MTAPFKMVVEAANNEPESRMAICAGVAEAQARHAGDDPAAAIMALVWAAAHVGRVNGVPLARLPALLKMATKYAIECEEDIAARDRPQ